MYGTTKNLHVTSLTQEQHEKTCGYWYTVTDGAMAHTAFATERGLLHWMQERGLELTAPLPARGTWSTQKIQGNYTRICTMDLVSFERLAHENHPKIKILDNGEYTMGIVTTNENGSKTVHHLNCNIRTRPVYDYQQTRAELDGEGEEVQATSYAEVTRMQQRIAELEDLLGEALSAVESTSSGLAAWVEIADEEDLREHDDVALEQAGEVSAKIREALGLPQEEPAPAENPAG